MAEANRRHRMRELAMQVLFLWDTQGQPDEQAARQVTQDASDDPALRQQAVEMAAAAWEQREAADRWVGKLAPQWPPNRQPAVDRAILRLAVWEMINTATPPKVVLDEAIELAKSYSTELSARFVNGVLDAVLREHKALTAGAPVIVERGADEPVTHEPMPDDQGMAKDQ
jgi:transcription antitermination protein NusB